MTIDFELLLQQPDLGLRLARGICQRHHLPQDCARVTGGSRLVFASAGRYLIKIFPPEDAAFFETEAAFLAHLDQKLPVHTPALSFSGCWEVYPYLVMEYLTGTPLDRLWDALSEADRRDILNQLGESIRALHDLPVRDFPPLPFDWHPFIDRQRAALLDDQRAYGLGEAWLAQLPAYTGSLAIDFHDPAALVPLHTELMQEHVFVRRDGPRWRLSGLIDFEPSMIGHRDYEFCAVGLFLTQGHRDLFRAFLTGYGYAEFPETLSRRIMIFMLLHRYGDLNRFLPLLPERLTTLRELEQFWYGV